MAIFSIHLISISSNPSSIHLNLFLYLRQYKCMSIFFYLFVNINSRLYFSISPFLSYSILHLSTSIFFYLILSFIYQIHLFLFSCQSSRCLISSYYKFQTLFLSLIISPYNKRRSIH